MTRLKLITAIALSLALVGCGGGGGGDDPVASDPSEPPEQKAPDAGGSIELATVPSLKDTADLIPPGVPRLE